MPKRVQLPDGNIGEFPDAMSDADIEGVLKKQFPPTPAPKPASFLERYDAAVEPYTRIEAPDAKDRWNPKEAVKAVGNIGAGGLGMILHPINTLESIGGVLTAPVEMATGTPFSKTVPGQFLKSVKENPYGAIEAGVGQAGATAGLGRVAEAIPRAARTITEKVTNTGPKKVGELVKQTKAENSAADLAHADKAQEAVRKQGAERAKAIEKKRGAEAEHKAATEQVKTGNKQAVKVNTQAEEMPAKRQAAYRELQGQIETARENALTTGNEKYSGVNSALNPIEADPETVRGALADALESLKGSKTEPTILKDIEKRLQKGDSFTYEDLQGDYSRLGRELSKGTLPGDEFHAYDVLHEALGEEMQRIADQEGLGAQLTDARNYWRRMKQAFGKPYNPSDAATATMEKSSPDIARAEEETNRRRLLASFDPSIQGTFEHLDNLEKGAKALGAPKPVREVLKPNPPPPDIKVPRMKDAPVPDRPEAKTIGPAEVREAKTKGLEHRVDRIRSRGEWIATGAAGYRALSSLLHGNIGAIPADIFEGGVALAGVEGISRLLENPKVVEMLTRPTPADIAQIPPELRGDFSQIAQIAAKKGIRVDPRLYAAAGAVPQRKPVAAALAGR